MVELNGLTTSYSSRSYIFQNECVDVTDILSLFCLLSFVLIRKFITRTLKEGHGVLNHRQFDCLPYGWDQSPVLLTSDWLIFLAKDQWCGKRSVSRRVYNIFLSKMSMVITGPDGLCLVATGSYIHHYRKTSNTIRTLVCNELVDQSDVVGGAAPTTSSFST